MTRKNKPNSGEAEQPDNIPAPLSEAEDESLAATRRALIEAEENSESNTGMLKKVARKLKGNKGARKKKDEVVDLPAIASPASGEVGSEAAAEQAAREEEELLNIIEQARQEIASNALQAPAAEPVEQTQPAAVASVTEPVALADLRDVALENYEEAPAPSPEKPHKPISKRVENWADRIQYRTLVRMTLASLTAVVCLATIIVGLFVLQLPAIQFSRPTPSPTVVVPTISSPTPMQVRLPGGWGFVLSRGEIVEGKWTPTKAEWLGGTEICRWVSLPYSQQLEAVINTFKPGDHIDLIMTNYDHWSYIVKSVSKVKVFELAGMDKNYPSLLLILTNPDSDERLVIFAVQR